MKRQELTSKYQSMFDQAKEKSADWYVYGHAWALLAGSGAVDWVRSELAKAREQSLQNALELGHRPDHDYGTYGVYMQTKVNLYNGVLEDLSLVEEVQGMTEVERI